MLTTNNEAWGFWGTMRQSGQSPEDAWPLAMQAIVTATGKDEVYVREFLDGRGGRHFADEVSNQLFIGKPLAQAIDAAVAQWLRWKSPWE